MPIKDAGYFYDLVEEMAYRYADGQEYKEVVEHLMEKHDLDVRSANAVAKYAKQIYDSVRKTTKETAKTFIRNPKDYDTEEREFKTYEGWKRFIKNNFADPVFEGDKDIAFAFITSKVTGKKIGLGEWDGAKGVIYLQHPEKFKGNPPDGVKIYDTILAIEARKGTNSLWPKEDFRHKFSTKSKAEVIGLKDGSLLVRSQTGKRLWKIFDY